MRALSQFLFGLLAYVACTVNLLYLIGFSGNLGVPKSVDAGIEIDWWRAAAVDVGLIVLFGLQHSVMARRGFKRWWTRVVPVALERSTFVLATCVVLDLLFWGWAPIATPVVWRVEQPLAEGLLWTLFALGWVVALVSTFLLDHFELFGLRQASAALTRREPRDAGLRTPLFYRWVRHPLYAGFLLTFWAVPVMTVGRLLFALGMSAYVLVGIAFEERDLLRQFGDRYRAYRQRVGMLVPRARRRVRENHHAGPSA